MFPVHLFYSYKPLPSGQQAFLHCIQHYLAIDDDHKQEFQCALRPVRLDRREEYCAWRSCRVFFDAHNVVGSNIWILLFSGSNCFEWRTFGECYAAMRPVDSHVSYISYIECLLFLSGVFWLSFYLSFFSWLRLVRVSFLLTFIRQISSAAALGIVSIIISSQPNTYILSGKAGQFGVAWLSISVGFNIIVTLMLSVRLLHAQREFRRYATDGDTKTYTGVVAILVESAFPLALSGFIAAIFYGIEHPAAFAIENIWSFFEVHIVCLPEAEIITYKKLAL